MQRSCPRLPLKHLNGALKSVCVLLFDAALLMERESFKVRNRFSDASRGNRVEYTCSPPRADRPHPHSNQTLLHTARNSLLNFNSLSSSTTEMPWLVWQPPTDSGQARSEMFLTPVPIRKNSSDHTSQRLPNEKRSKNDRCTASCKRHSRHSRCIYA